MTNATYPQIVQKKMVLIYQERQQRGENINR